MTLAGVTMAGNGPFTLLGGQLYVSLWVFTHFLCRRVAVKGLEKS